MAGRIHFLSAGAGSGKTYRLTEILYEKLSGGAVSPAGVIATTFTRKAAAELRERVRTALLGKGAQRLANAMGQARIGTVNSVCGSFLERFAFEAGLATEQRVLEEEQASALLRESIDEVATGAVLGEIVAIADRLGIENWSDELKKLVDQSRANDIDAANLPGFAQENASALLAHFPQRASQDLNSLLLRAIDAALPELKQGAEKGQKKNTAQYLDLVQSLRREIKADHSTWASWVKLSKSSPEAGLASVAEPISRAAGRYGEHAGLHADVARYLEILFSLCAQILGVYAERKREMGVLDFTDQEHLFLKVLEKPAVEAALREELDLLLVDEFQDTSPIQLALFLKLASFARETYWVGDVKQAIYGFRGSDTALMQAVLLALPGMGAKTEVLGSSWRARPPLVALTNAIFVKAFGEDLQPKEIVLKAERKEVLDGPAFSNWILDGKNRELQNSALADGVRSLVASGTKVVDVLTGKIRPVSFGDIAILSRSNAGVVGIAEALRAQAIPWATQQPGLLGTPEATLALACLRRLNDPTDTIASAEVISLADCEEPETWLADRLRYLAANGEPQRWREEANAHPLLARLAGMRNALPVLSPREALELVMTKFDIAGHVLRWRRDGLVARVRLANIEALLGLAEKYEDSCRATHEAATISGLILWFAETAERKLDMLAEPALDAVKVMTHHAAKGLEWPVVILTDLAADIQDRLWSVSAISRKPINVATPLADRFIRYWPWPFGSQKKVSIADEIANSKAAAPFRAEATREAKRLLYVSMTRARDLLICAHQGKKQTGEWIETLDAPWFLPQAAGPSDTLPLPAGGVVPYMSSTLHPPEAQAAARKSDATLHWFEWLANPSQRLPRAFLASAAPEVGCRVLESADIGTRIALKANPDMAMLGSAIHACIAASFTDRDAPLDEAEVSAVLGGMGVGGAVSPDAVRGQIAALHDWIETRWPKCQASSEIPVEWILRNEQVMEGRIDLLLKVDQGWILFDHKSNPGGRKQWEEVARNASGQLAAYAEAIARATGVAVLEKWVFLPVAAVAVRIA